MSHIPILPDLPNGGKRPPPNLYTSALICPFFAMANNRMPNAANAGALRCYGQVRMPRVGESVYVATARQISQWIGRRNHIIIPHDLLDRMLQAEITRLENANALPPSQSHISTTPHDQLRWTSNYAHHGGRTV